MRFVSSSISANAASSGAGLLRGKVFRYKYSIVSCTHSVHIQTPGNEQKKKNEEEEENQAPKCIRQIYE